MSNGSDIIIKGGSAGIIFVKAVYPEDPHDDSVHSNQSKKITRITITGDIQLDVEFNGGFKGEIVAHCK